MLQDLKKYSVPRSPSKNGPHHRITPAIDPAGFTKLYRYCLQDVRAEANLSEVVPDLSEFEERVWVTDQIINERGVQVDAEAIRDCTAVVALTRAKHSARLIEITGDPTSSIDKVAQVKKWVEAQGIIMNSFDKECVQATIDRLRPEFAHVREVLGIRQALGSSSVRKLATLLRTTCADGRVRGLFAYHAAATGRWGGRMAQPQNLPRGGPAIKRVDEALEDFRKAAVDQDVAPLEEKWGDVLSTVGSVLRGLFVSRPGTRLISSDYSAIEAVVLAELAEEPWRQGVFRTHGRIYEATAADIAGVPLSEVTPELRQMGKVSELSSGYQGGINAWKRFGADEFMTDAQILRAIQIWRAKSPNIVAFWRGLEKAAKLATEHAGMPFGYKRITYEKRDNDLYCRLPSGRELVYHSVRLEPGEYGLQIVYMGWNTDRTKGPYGWSKRHTYGGAFCENICQGVARDVLANALVNLESCGYPVVLHVHDEVVSEVPLGAGTVAQFEGVMNVMPAWAQGWPIKAKGGWEGHRYRKG